MKKYLLSESSNFYKANLHCHTTFSDGRLTPAEVKDYYQSLGYSIVAYTDHDILIAHDELSDDRFLALHGYEIEVTDNTVNQFVNQRHCHLCFIGIEPDNLTQPFWNSHYARIGNASKNAHLVKFDESEKPFDQIYDSECINTMIKGCREKGFFVTYNHPVWSLESYPEYMSYNGMHAMEIFNGDCIAAGFQEYNPMVYDDMLRGGKRIYCIGADDNHNHASRDSRRYDSGWAWTVINADSLDYRTVTKALEDGRFYASEGPEIYELWYEDGMVHIRCSDADHITCNYFNRSAEVTYSEFGEPLDEATFSAPSDRTYFRITVTDRRGKKACTNAYFMSDLI